MLYIAHTAITDFTSIPVENLVQGVAPRKTPVHECYEFLPDVGANILTKWRVEPEDVAFSGSPVAGPGGIKFQPVIQYNYSRPELSGRVVLHGRKIFHPTKWTIGVY